MNGGGNSDQHNWLEIGQRGAGGGQNGLAGEKTERDSDEKVYQSM